MQQTISQQQKFAIEKQISYAIQDCDEVINNYADPMPGAHPYASNYQATTHNPSMPPIEQLSNNQPTKQNKKRRKKRNRKPEQKNKIPRFGTELDQDVHSNSGSPPSEIPISSSSAIQKLVASAGDLLKSDVKPVVISLGSSLPDVKPSPTRVRQNNKPQKKEDKKFEPRVPCKFFLNGTCKHVGAFLSFFL
jgi:hypothetical protein